MPLPAFKYHPNPIQTGSIQARDTVCECCGKARGYIYVGPVYAVEELEECICPWCIASGLAAEKFDADFVDPDGVGQGWEPVKQDIVQEVSRRTPGFPGWQQERWWTHCSDAGEFIGRAGAEEVMAHGDFTMTSMREDTGLDDPSKLQSYVDMLSKDGQPTAYLFRCRTCGMVGGYSDCT